MLQIGLIEYAPVAIKIAGVIAAGILVYAMVLLQSGLFEERLKSHGAVVGSMKKGRFVTLGQCEGVVYFVVGVSGSDIKLTHEVGHPTENAGNHFDTFGTIGIAIRKVEGFGILGQFVEVGRKWRAIAKAGIITSQTLHDDENDVGLHPSAALTARHWKPGQWIIIEV